MYRNLTVRKRLQKSIRLEISDCQQSGGNCIRQCGNRCGARDVQMEEIYSEVILADEQAVCLKQQPVTIMIYCIFQLIP